VMAGAVEMLDVGGIRAGKSQLGRLKTPSLCRTVSDGNKLSCKRKLFPQVNISYLLATSNPSRGGTRTLTSPIHSINAL
jgi:hypothetical protein